MAVTLERFADLTARLHAAPDVAALARDYLADARRLVRAPGLGFDVLDPRTRRPTYTGGAGVSDFFLSRYEAEGRALDPVLAEAVRRREPVASARLMSAREWRAHPVFRAVYEMHDFAGVLQAPLVHGDAVLGVLIFGAHRAAIGAGDERVAGALARTVTAALVTLRRQEAVERECATLAAALEICDQALVITDASHGSRRMNRAARALLARLRSPWTLDDQLARASEHGGGATVSARVRLTDGQDTALRTQIVAPPDGAPGVSVAILALDDAAAAPLPASVGALLTRREGEVARRAAAGLRTEQIARELGISPNTVKQYLKASYRKLGVSCRAQLARRLCL